MVVGLRSRFDSTRTGLETPVLGFGKYKGKPFADVYNNHPDYVAWCCSHLARTCASHTSWLDYIEDRVKENEDNSGSAPASTGAASGTGTTPGASTSAASGASTSAASGTGTMREASMSAASGTGTTPGASTSAAYGPGGGNINITISTVVNTEADTVTETDNGSNNEEADVTVASLAQRIRALELRCTRRNRSP